MGSHIVRTLKAVYVGLKMAAIRSKHVAQKLLNVLALTVVYFIILLLCPT